jgi:TIR domain-containing protein
MLIHPYEQGVSNMTNIFLSWSRETKTVAEAINKWLTSKKGGIKCWFSSEDINAGQKWRAEIDNALNSADCAIICIGPSAVVSPWVLYETGAIGSRKPIIPIALLISPSSVPPVLSGYQFLNAYQANRLSPDPAFPKNLLNGINSTIGTNISVKGDVHDKKLLDGLHVFADERAKSLHATLLATEQNDALTKILRYVKANKSGTLEEIVDTDPTHDRLSKKYHITLALMWLKEKGFINIFDFDNIDSGRVELSYDGEIILTYLDNMRK